MATIRKVKKKIAPASKKVVVVSKDAAKKRLYHLTIEAAELADKHSVPFVGFLLDPTPVKKEDKGVATDRAVCIANADQNFLHQAITALFMQHRELAKRMMKDMLIGNTDADGNLVADEPVPEVVLPFQVTDLVKIHPPPPNSEPDSDFLAAFHGREASITFCGPKSSTVRLRNEAGDMISLAFDNQRLEKIDRVLEVVRDEEAPEETETAVDAPAQGGA